jgi:hypothetical protein
MDARRQYFQRLRLVAVLATTVLALGHDACGKVRDTHGRVGFVDVLPPGAAGAIGVNAQVGRVDLYHGASSCSASTATVQALVWIRP